MASSFLSETLLAIGLHELYCNVCHISFIVFDAINLKKVEIEKLHNMSATINNVQSTTKMRIKMIPYKY